MMRIGDCMHSVVLLDDRIGVVLASTQPPGHIQYSTVQYTHARAHTLPMDLDMSRQGDPCHELAV